MAIDDQPKQRNRKFNLSSTNPPPPPGGVPVLWQKDPTGVDISGYVTGIPAGGAAIFADPVGSEVAPASDGWLEMYTNGYTINRYRASIIDEDPVDDAGGIDNWEPWGPIFPFVRPHNPHFGWINQGPATVDISHGGINLFAPFSGATNLRCRMEPLVEVEGQFQINIGFIAGMFGQNTQGCGIVMGESIGSPPASGPLVTFQITTVGASGISGGSALGTDGSGVSGLLLEVRTYDDPTTLNSILYSQAIPVPFPFLRVEQDCSDMNFFVSHNGQHFVQVFTMGRQGFITADEVGFFANNETSIYDLNMTLLHYSLQEQACAPVGNIVITRVNTAEASNAVTPVTLLTTQAWNLTTDNAVVVFVRSEGTDPVSITDIAGNIYVLEEATFGHPSPNALWTYVCEHAVGQAGNTVTVNFSGAASYMWVFAIEYHKTINGVQAQLTLDSTDTNYEQNTQAGGNCLTNTLTTPGVVSVVVIAGSESGQYGFLSTAFDGGGAWGLFNTPPAFTPIEPRIGDATSGTHYGGTAECFTSLAINDIAHIIGDGFPAGGFANVTGVVIFK